jgi:hypothetical protein
MTQLMAPDLVGFGLLIFPELDAERGGLAMVLWRATEASITSIPSIVPAVMT